jgi:hypothetical protein
MLTRLRPGGWVILIQTRWHEDDLAGRIIAEMESGGEQWDIVSLPAEAEAGDLLGRRPGQWLWDDDYGYGDFLRHEKATQPPRNWSALYQQRPAPESGNYFKVDWLRSYASEPPRETLNIYGGSNYAVISLGGDYTVHVVVGVDPENRMYLLDLWRGQTSSDVWIEAWCAGFHFRTMSSPDPDINGLRDQAASQEARQFEAFHAPSGSPREDSNLEPDRYETRGSK